MESQAQKFRKNQRILVLPKDFFNKEPSRIKYIYTDSIDEEYEFEDNNEHEHQEKIH